MYIGGLDRVVSARPGQAQRDNDMPKEGFVATRDKRKENDQKKCSKYAL
jgi:hypothetical protein